jgi:hypothetical protein
MRRVIYSSSDSTHLPPHPTMCACEWRPRLPLSLVYNLLVSNKTTKCRRRRRRRRVSLLFFVIAQPLVYPLVHHRTGDVGDTSLVRPLSTLFEGCAHSIILALESRK